MRRFESDYRINEGDDVLARENAIHQDLDLRVDAVELLGQAFAEGNRADIDAILKSLEMTFSGLAAEMRGLLDQASGGLSADIIVETAARYFLTDARRAAILSELRGGVDGAGDTLAKLFTLIAGVVGGAPAGRQTLKAINDVVVANTATLNAITSGADPTLDSFAEALTRFVIDEGQISGLMTMVGNRLRGDAAGGYTAAQVAQFLANLGLTDRQPGVGDLVMTLGNTAPPGCIPLTGGLVQRANYPALWSWVQSYGVVATDAVWLSGTTAAFSSGDGVSSFRVPEFRGEFLRMWDYGRGIDGGRLLGTIQGQNLPPHFHKNAFGWDGSYFYGWQDANSTPIFGSEVQPQATALRVQGAGSTAARISFTDTALYGVNQEVRPRNVSVLACVRYK